MPPWWSSIESLQHFILWIRWGLIAIGVLGALIGAANLIVGNQIESLKAEQSRRTHEQLEVTQRELQETKQRVQPRSLTAEQRKRLLAALRKGPAGSVSITAVVGDAESMGFAAQLKEVLQEAGWPTTGIGQVVLGGVVKGLIISVHGTNAIPAHAVTLQQALNSLGFEAQGNAASELAPDSIGLLVGVKP
jgi:hypothetical protein